MEWGRLNQNSLWLPFKKFDILHHGRDLFFFHLTKLSKQPYLTSLQSHEALNWLPINFHMGRKAVMILISTENDVLKKSCLKLKCLMSWIMFGFGWCWTRLQTKFERKGRLENLRSCQWCVALLICLEDFGGSSCSQPHFYYLSSPWWCLLVAVLGVGKDRPKPVCPVRENEKLTSQVGVAPISCSYALHEISRQWSSLFHKCFSAIRADYAVASNHLKQKKRDLPPNVVFLRLPMELD